ncbi:C2 domain containing protein [Parasponia andersonii]|uniref:C2 domain containing protein n=1 Tax=Parasponia andersonii TaxID=3476 RepID=A0A2P5CFS7_PARAD|nr:C2 domain containing protein [Parasponia andersonii]
MEYRSLEINLSSLEFVKQPRIINDFFFKTRVYAVVSIVTTTSTTRLKTPLAKFINGKNHVWELYFPTRFYVDESKLQQDTVTLMIQIRKKRHFCMDNDDVGEVHVPLKELFDPDMNPPNDIVISNCSCCHVVTSTSGKPKGYLHFSYKFSDKFDRR